jgi:hypothetical protein
MEHKDIFLTLLIYNYRGRGRAASYENKKREEAKTSGNENGERAANY